MTLPQFPGRGGRASSRRLQLAVGVLSLLALLATYLNSHRGAARGRDTWHYVAPHQFEGFDNETGAPEPIVPNIIHFLRFSQPEIKFQDLICILAAFRNHKPDYIYFHTDLRNFTGKYWDFLLDFPGFSEKHKVLKVELPATIFGQKFSDGWHKYHAGDVTRIRILMQHGGIFLDNDSFLVQSLDTFRRFEMVVGYENEDYLGTQVLIAHRNARFLRLWLESYRGHYDPTLWYFNAGQYPSTSVLAKRPELIHKVKFKFGVHIITRLLYLEYWKNWRTYYAVHLLMNHRYYLAEKCFDLYPTFNESSILNPSCNFTFCEMARDVFYGKLVESLFRSSSEPTSSVAPQITSTQEAPSSDSLSNTFTYNNSQSFEATTINSDSSSFDQTTLSTSTPSFDQTTLSTSTSSFDQTTLSTSTSSFDQTTLSTSTSSFDQTTLSTSTSTFNKQFDFRSDHAMTRTTERIDTSAVNNDSLTSDQSTTTSTSNPKITVANPTTA